MITNYKYKAFISYTHSDKAIAEKLQKLLERYRPPKDIAPDNFTHWRVFRDTTELSVGDDLNELLKENLASSEFLVVICSENSTKSYWCSKEVEYFKEIHEGSTDKIIPVIVSGNPKEVMPQALLTKLVPVSEDSGTVLYEEKSIEPLAVNISDSTLKNTLKKLSTEHLRIAARFLDCDFESLYRRALREKTQKAIVTGAVSTLVFFLFALYSGAMLIKINNQHQELLVENARNLVSLSSSLFSQGDEINAINTLLSAFPQKGESFPVLPEAENLLAQEIDAFSISSFKPVHKFNHSKAVERAHFAGNGHTLVTKADTTVYLWDTATGKLKAKFPQPNSSFTVFFDSDYTIEDSDIARNRGGWFLLNDSGILGYEKNTSSPVQIKNDDIYIDDLSVIKKIDALTGEVVWSIDYENTISITAHANVTNSHIVVYTTKNVFLYSKADGAFIAQYELSHPTTNSLISSGWLSFSDTKAYYCDDQLSSFKLYSYDIQGSRLTNPQLLYSYENDDYTSAYLLYAKEHDNKLVVINSYTDSVFYTNATAHIYDLNTSKLLYSYDFNRTKSNFVASGVIYGENANNYCDILYLVCSNKLVLLNLHDGNVLHEYTLDGNAICTYSSVKNFVYVITSNSSEIAIPVKNITSPSVFNEDFIGKYVTKTFRNKPYNCAYYNNLYAIIPQDSLNVYLYSEVKNEDFTEISVNEPQESNYNFIFNPDGSYAYFYDYEQIDNSQVTVAYILDAKTNTAREFYRGNYISKAMFAGNDRICIVANNKTKVYDVASGKELYSYDNYSYKPQTTSSGEVFFIASGNLIHSQNNKFIEWESHYAGYIHKFKASDYNKVIMLTENFEADKYVFEVLNLSDGSTALIDYPVDDYQDVSEFIWLSDELVAVLFKNNTIAVFDATTAKAVNSFTIDIPSIISVTNVDNSLILLCNDSVVYKLNPYTSTIEASVDLNNSNIKSADSDQSHFQCVPEDNLLVVGWGVNLLDNVGYFINLDSFKIRYAVFDYSSYNKTYKTVAITRGNVTGSFPLYTTNELVDKAIKYSSK